MTDDPYEILGLNRDATPEEVAAAFKRAAKKSHPDTGGSNDEFARVTQAALVLKDPSKRKRYDEDGTIDENRPDNKQAQAMERVVNFFINSINATLDQNPGYQSVSLDQLDLVQGGRDWFNQQIGGCYEQINKVERQVKQFDRVLKRLKSKKKKDQLRKMLEHHKGQIQRLIAANKAEIEVHKLSLEILEDYSFEQEQQLLINRYQSTGGFWR